MVYALVSVIFVVFPDEILKNLKTQGLQAVSFPGFSFDVVC